MLAVLLGTCLAYPSYRQQLPLADRVPCPSGAEGCYAGDADLGQPPSVCFGLGHRTCLGGTLPLNAFGEAFKAAGGWTQALCEADSDGDGRTNGEELGDPCCAWAPYDTQSEAMATFVPSHPGVHEDFDSEYERPDCASIAPVAKAELLGVFGEDEEIRTVDLLVRGYEIPAERTTYVNIGVNVPEEVKGLFHVVRIDVIVNQSAHLHHFIINGCRERFPAERDGLPTESMGGDGECSVPYGGWAPGKCIFCPPLYAGLAFGPSAGVVAFDLQVHYDNPAGVAGVRAFDGIRIHYTPSLRPRTVSSFNILQLSFRPRREGPQGVSIPPGEPRYFVTRSCKVKVEDSGQDDPAVNLVSMGYHAHLLGREMYMEVRPREAAAAYSLGSEPVWHFDDQYLRNLLPEKVSLRTGDHIQSTCVYDSSDRAEKTVFGINTQDEMCWASFQYWPGSADVTCDGPVWFGPLQIGEVALGIEGAHPPEGAVAMLDGVGRNGGSLCAKEGCAKASDRGPACVDNPMAEDMCPRILERMTSSEDCDFDLSQQMPRLSPGDTILNLCCTRACEELCPDHPACSAGGEQGDADTAEHAEEHAEGAEDAADAEVESAAAAACMILALLQ